MDSGGRASFFSDALLYWDDRVAGSHQALQWLPCRGWRRPPSRASGRRDPALLLARGPQQGVLSDPRVPFPNGDPIVPEMDKRRPPVDKTRPPPTRGQDLPPFVEIALMGGGSPPFEHHPRGRSPRRGSAPKLPNTSRLQLIDYDGCGAPGRAAARVVAEARHWAGVSHLFLLGDGGESPSLLVCDTQGCVAVYSGLYAAGPRASPLVIPDRREFPRIQCPMADFQCRHARPTDVQTWTIGVHFEEGNPLKIPQHYSPHAKAGPAAMALDTAFRAAPHLVPGKRAR
eukprot:gene5586-biopygen11762